MRGKRLWVVLAVFAVAAVAFALYWGQPRHLATVHPQRGTAVEAIYATGTVEPVRWAQIAPMVPGRILGLEAEEGDMVEAGTVLIRLDDRAAQAELVQREADARFLKSEVDRLGTLVRRETASRQSYDRAISELDQARAAAEAARKRLSEFTIVAPFPARVLRKEGEIGEVVQPGAVLYWLGTPEPWRGSVEVDE